MKLDTGIKAWGFGYTQYFQDTVKNIEEYLRQKVKSLSAKGVDVLTKKYSPEIDISEELGAQEASYFQYLIGILLWIIELGRVDICTDTSMMSSHITLPQRGNLESLFHMFSYLKNHQNSEILFDPTELNFDMADFQREDWGLIIYCVVEEEMRPIVLFTESERRGQAFTMKFYVDCNLGGDCVT